MANEFSLLRESEIDEEERQVALDDVSPRSEHGWSSRALAVAANSDEKNVHVRDNTRVTR